MSTATNYSVLILVMILAASVGKSQGLFEWLFGGGQAQGEEGKQVEVGSLLKTNRQVPFEMATVDEKFLMEVAGLKLSQLDLCHHEIVGKLRTSCGGMSEDDLGKLSVMLFNCQAENEGRKTYPCTEDMTLSSCTKDMDSTTWNAYQIVSNRARAICYTARQQQFRLKTESTVNKLVTTANIQLDSMKQLQEGQKKIGEATTDTLKKMYEGQQELMIRQNMLKSAQANVQMYIAGNLRELTREKSLIAAGNKELADMTERIKMKLDEATSQLNRQEGEQKRNHLELLDDLSDIRKKAEDVWEKIDASGQHVLTFQKETVKQYEATLDNLRRVNATMNYVLTKVDTMKTGLDKQLGWLSSVVGETEDSLHLMVTCVLHVVYFLLAALSAAFLQTPGFTRGVLLTLVPVNALSEVKQKKSLDFFTMTLLILLTVGVNWFCKWVCYMRTVRRSELCQCTGNCSSVQCQGQTTQEHKKPAALSSDRESSFTNGSSRAMDRQHRVDHYLNTSTSSVLDTPRTSRASTPRRTTPLLATPSVLPATPSVLPATPMPDQEASFTAAETPRLLEVSQVKRHLLDTLDGRSTSRRRRSRSRSRTPLKVTDGISGTSTPARPLCLGTTKTGQPCKLACTHGKDFCHRHSPKDGAK
ncbi:protein brambleberry isoform X3 [Lingula anatina]|uniref:Protein brambleberry isoform X3 n=1 Tax=Lingula anatina TaxID=7574 RepID=A0A1S3K9M5_LINAN|nr:protein brambleberry isoform X3 [Lingula anatina]|eukprot:XP_013418956.1 protein brambleberry isoform X3 [Lingula anatina]